MSRLALGTAQFGMPYGIANQTGQVSRPSVKAMLKLAETNGIDMLDTAIAYGESEACLGEAGISNFKVITKLPAVPIDCVDISAWVDEQMDLSFSRLGVNSVYGLLVHCPDQLLGTNGQKLYLALQNLKKNGRIQKAGISVYTPSELEMLIPRYRFDLVQAPLNLIDQRLLTSGWLKKLKEQNIEIHTRSVFLQGLLLMPKTDIPAKFASWSGLWDQWHGWRSCHEVSAVEACLAFVLSFPEIDRIVVGAEHTGQLQQILDAAVCAASDDLPDLRCDEENLVNPSQWQNL